MYANSPPFYNVQIVHVRSDFAWIKTFAIIYLFLKCYLTQKKMHLQNFKVNIKKNALFYILLMLGAFFHKRLTFLYTSRPISCTF